MAHIENLKSLTREQLVEVAMKQGLPKPHHKAKPETIIKSIVDSMTPQKPVNHEAKQQESKVAEIRNTRESIEPMLDRLKAERQNLSWEFDELEETVTVRHAHAAVSFNWHIPLRVIERHVRLHVFNPTRPLGLNNHFDEMPSASGKNAYTNTVLA